MSASECGYLAFAISLFLVIGVIVGARLFHVSGYVSLDWGKLLMTSGAVFVHSMVGFGLLVVAVGICVLGGVAIGFYGSVLLEGIHA